MATEERGESPAQSGRDPEEGAPVVMKSSQSTALDGEKASLGQVLRSRGFLTVAGLCAAVIAIVVLVMTNFKDSSVYDKGVDQIVGDKSHWIGRPVRLEGSLVKGTLLFRETPCEFQFDATRNGTTVHVRFPSCIKPDTLRDDIPEEVGVTALGKLQDNGEFLASEVLAKCPSKYERKEMEEKGYQRPGSSPTAASPAPGTPPASVLSP